MLWLIVAAPVIFAVAGIAGWLWIARQLDREPTDTDRYCDRMDRELSAQEAAHRTAVVNARVDELAARRATRLAGNVVVEFRPRQRRPVA